MGQGPEARRQDGRRREQRLARGEALNAPRRDLDHLVVAARSLEEGVAWVEARLGVAPGPGGKHPLMGTHNRLLRIGPREFLEVIAIDPQAPAPARARWFELDSPAMREKLARGPALVHWVERTWDIEAALADYPQPIEIVAATRGEFRWRISIPPDGSFPGHGLRPTLIQWEGSAHPTDGMADSGCRLTGFSHENGVLAADFAGRSGMRRITGGPRRPE